MANTNSWPSALSSSPNQTPYAGRADWTTYQATVTELYTKHTLAEVKDIMEIEYGFRATDKMYKTRLRKWGLEKKGRERESKPPVRNPIPRAGEETFTYGIRGVINHEATPEGVAPPTFNTLSFSYSYPSPVSVHHNLAILDQILPTLQGYFRSFQPTGTRKRIGKEMDRVVSVVFLEANPALNCFSEHCIEAFETLARYQYRGVPQAFQALSLATARIKDLVRANHPRTLPHLFAAAMDFCQLGRPEIALAIFRHFSNMGGVVLGEKHPLKLVCGWLATSTPTPNFYKHILSRCIQMVWTSLNHTLRPLIPIPKEAQTAFCQYLWDTRSEAQSKAITSILQECNLILGYTDEWTIRVQLQLAYHYLRWYDLTQLRKAAEIIVKQTDSRHLRCLGLYLLAISQNFLGEEHAADLILREAIDVGIQEWGPKGSWVNVMKLTLKSWLLRREKLDCYSAGFACSSGTSTDDYREMPV